MKSRVLFALVMALLLTATGLMASEARMVALGSPHGFVRDNTDIFVYPGLMNRYNKLIMGEMDNSAATATWTLGANLPVMGNVFGLYLNKPTGVDVDQMLGFHSDYAIGDLDISRKITMLFGFMDTFGVGFAMAIDSETTPATATKDIEKKANFFEVKGGMSTDMMDAGLNVYMAAASTLNDDTKEEETAGIFGFGLNGRYFVRDEADFTMMATLGFDLQMYSSEYKAAPAAATVEDSQMDMMFDFGVGANWKIANAHTIIAAVKPIKFETSAYEAPNEDKTTFTSIYVPEYYLGVESQIAKWLVGRVGANQSYEFGSMKFEPKGGTTVESSGYDSDFEMCLGLGFKFGNFMIDTVIKNNLLFDGPEFIGGAASGLASHVSIVYNF